MILFFDTETTGKVDFRSPVDACKEVYFWLLKQNGGAK